MVELKSIPLILNAGIIRIFNYSLINVKFISRKIFYSLNISINQFFNHINIYKIIFSPNLISMKNDLQKLNSCYFYVRCGYATIHNVQDKTLEDRMESFFLSETCKYLFLVRFACNLFVCYGINRMILMLRNKQKNHFVYYGINKIIPWQLEIFYN